MVGDISEHGGTRLLIVTPPRIIKLDETPAVRDRGFRRNSSLQAAAWDTPIARTTGFM